MISEKCKKENADPLATPKTDKCLVNSNFFFLAASLKEVKKKFQN